MDAFQVLRNDHQKADRLILRLEATNPGARQSRENLFAELKRELQIHTQIEEDIFYPALERAEETANLVEESLHEHETVQQILDEMTQMEPDDADWDKMLGELKDNVQHHVREEETELFEKARLVLSVHESQAMGERLQDHRDELQRAL